MFLKISQNSQENICVSMELVSVSFLMKLLALTCNFIKNEGLAHVFSCEFYQISKNIFLKEHLWATASARCFNTLK